MTIVRADNERKKPREIKIRGPRAAVLTVAVAAGEDLLFSGFSYRRTVRFFLTFHRNNPDGVTLPYRKRAREIEREREGLQSGDSVGKVRPPISRTASVRLTKRNGRAKDN